MVEAKFSVTVWNRSLGPVDELVKLGAQHADTPARAVKEAELIFYCLSDDSAVEAVVFGEHDILSRAKAGQIALDMSTVYPSTSHREAAGYRSKGVELLDAPVFGSKK